MKKSLVFAIILSSACFAQSAPQAGPAATAASGGAGGGRAGGGGGGGAAEDRSNEQAGVDIDRFIGDPATSPVHLSHGTLLTHSILRAGDPYNPGSHGAVLEYRKDLSTATLLGMNRTPLSTLPDEYFFYVQSGEGKLDDGKQSWPLRPGIAVLAPPNVPHRLTNTSDKPLEMIMLTWAAAGTPKNELTVRDVNLLSYCEENAHWNNTSKCIFGAADGLFTNERIYLVMLQPWAVSSPHSHVPGTEEIWTKVTPGMATMLIGSELREMPMNSAYLVPPTGFTKHANLNLSKERVEWWLYVARGAGQPNTTSDNSPAARGANLNASAAAPAAVPGPAQTAGGGGGGRGGRGPANPNLSRDTQQATIAGTPIK
jgi:mannose-6-phosphate isomerase-like protein (cupin superfamily)